jgi:acetate kinase
MGKAILVLNAGSSSIKFAVLGMGEGGAAPAPLYRGAIDGIGNQPRFTVNRIAGPSTMELAGDQTLGKETRHVEALQCLLAWLDGASNEFQLAAVGHRVVHGGTAYTQPVMIDAQVRAALEKLAPFVPLHQPHNLAGIDVISRLRPELPQVACFDTAFHHTMDTLEQMYALPRSLTEEGIRRYGFHGLSYEYIADVLPDYLGTAANGRVIVAHLGNGASLCAMKNRQSVATTMGFTPLEGLPMGTRCGSLDPGAVLYLLQEKGMTVPELNTLLNHRSGLFGISGISGDMRELLASDHPHAREAIDYFVLRTGREIASLAGALGGLDALVFTAGIGENAVEVRERICRHAAWLGIELDRAANVRHGPKISAEGSPVSVWVIPTNEESVIARHTQRIVQQRKI